MPPTEFRFIVTFNGFLTHAIFAFLAIFLFYGIVFIANLLEIPFYLGYSRFIVDVVLLTPAVDKVLWFSSLIVSSTLIFAQHIKSGVKDLRGISVMMYGLVLVALIYVLFFGFEISAVIALVVSGLSFAAFSIFHSNGILGGKRTPVVLLVFYGMLMLLGVEVASLACWVYHLFSLSPVFSDGSWSAAFVEAQISSILYPVLPGILMVFSFSWIGELTFKGLLTKSKGVKAEPVQSRLIFVSKSSKATLMVVVISVVAGLFIGYYNFAVSKLFDSAFPGTDVPFYIGSVNRMTNATLPQAMGYAAKDDRFLYLILQYSCFWLSGLSPEVFITFVMPVVLVFLLMLAAFMLVRVGRSRFHAVTAMLVTVFSFQVTVGLYGGFYANWFALVFAYIFYGLLIIVLEGHRNLSLLVLTGLTSVAVLYIHPWTWILLVMMIPTAYMFVTFLLVWIRKTDFHRYIWEIKFLAVLLAINFTMFYVRNSLKMGTGAKVAEVEMFDPSLLNAFSMKYLLDRTFNYYVGGFYAYVPIIVLAILGVLSIYDYWNRYDRLLLTWLLIDSAMVFVNYPWHARFLYVTPFNIYVALGILYGAEQLSKFADSSRSRYMALSTFWVFYALSILLLLNYAVRCVMLKQFGAPGLTLTP